MGTVRERQPGVWEVRVALLHNAAAQDWQRLIAQLQGALNSRIAIEQAKGAITERANIGTDEAFARLRSFARDHNKDPACGGPRGPEPTHPTV